MLTSLDILSTFGVAVMLHGVLRPSAANWREGGLGAAANIVAAISLSWPIARIWAPQIATTFYGIQESLPWT